MKFFFLQGKRYKAVYRELRGILGKITVSLATVKLWCQHFKQGNFSFDDEHRPRRPVSDLGEAVSQLLKDKPFLSARVVAKRLATSPCIIKEILTRDLRTRQFPGRWERHGLSPANREKWVEHAPTDVPGAGKQ
jgi:hypothetical protein